MTVKELINKLRSFDEDHHVVVQTEDQQNWQTGREIVDVRFQSNCQIVIEDEI